MVIGSNLGRQPSAGLLNGRIFLCCVCYKGSRSFVVSYIRSSRRLAVYYSSVNMYSRRPLCSLTFCRAKSVALDQLSVLKEHNSRCTLIKALHGGFQTFKNLFPLGSHRINQNYQEFYSHNFCNSRNFLPMPLCRDIFRGKKTLGNGSQSGL